MATAGNRAVGRLVRQLQREDYTKPKIANVETTGITRIVVRGLAFGIDDFKDSYGETKDDVSTERTKTSESPKRRALVLMPDKLDPDQPVQVVLHFHGWVFRSWDPYAGYLVAKRGGSAPAGTVRDVDLEHWEQQLATLKGKGAQVVAILAQGRGSGHGGGGSTQIIPALGAGEAETADRGSLKSQERSKTENRIVDRLQPVDLVALYEAMNGNSDVDAVIKWVNAQLARLVPELDKDKAKALSATPVLRGYYGKRAKSYYRPFYRRLACLIKTAIASQVPAAHRDDVSDYFRIIEVAPPADAPKGATVEHEQVVSRSLADALLAQRDPRRDHAQAVVPDDEECKKYKT